MIHGIYLPHTTKMATINSIEEENLIAGVDLDERSIFALDWESVAETISFRFLFSSPLADGVALARSAKPFAFYGGQ